MADWETRAGTLTNLHDHYEDAKEYQLAVADRVTWMMVEANAGEWLMAFARCSQALEFVRSALSSIYYVKSADPLEFALTFFLETYTVADAGEFDLTWEKIIDAWSDGGEMGWYQTVKAIDEMRKGIFNSPVLGFEELLIYK